MLRKVMALVFLLLIAGVVTSSCSRATGESGMGPINVNGAPRGWGGVVLYGDSIIRGEYLTYAGLSPTDVNARLEEPIAETLQRLRPHLQVDDRSLSGQTLTNLASGFPCDLRTSRVVVIENGVIDAWQGTSLLDFVVTLRKLIDGIRAEGRVPVLTGFARQVTGPLISPAMIERRDLYDKAVRTVALTMGVVFADLGAARFDGALDIPDGVHPGKAYSDRLAERIALALDAAYGLETSARRSN